MEYIGERISVLKKDNELSIVILSLKNEVKNKFLLAWILLWTICGILVFSQYSLQENEDIKSIIIVWLGFWAYFEYKIITAYRWRRNGLEKLKLKDGKLSYLKGFGKKKKYKTYNIDFIKNLRFIEPKENSFFENLNDSYWMTGNERIAFDYNGSEIKFGLQLPANDTQKLLKLLSAKIK